MKRCSFRGTWDVGVYLHDSYVPELDELAFNGASILHACVYVGATNAAKIRRIHTSTLPNDPAVPLVGIALYTGKNISLEDCVLQGPTVGISLYGPIISNPYFENTVCNIKLSDSTATSYSVNVIGGVFTKPYTGHPQYASRGPIIYSGNVQGLHMSEPFFLDTNVTDAAVWPMLFGSGGGGEATIIGAKYFGASGGTRAQLFRETAGVSPSLTVIGEPYGIYGATEIILKQDGSYGGNSQGIRVGSGGVISAVSWIPPTIATAVPALLKTAFYIPTMP